MQEKFSGLIHAFEDIMSSSSNDIGYTKLIEMGTETYPNLSSIALKLYTIPLKHQEWVTKELEDLEKAGIIQRSPYASPIVIGPKMSTRFTSARDKQNVSIIEC